MKARETGPPDQERRSLAWAPQVASLRAGRRKRSVKVCPPAKTCSWMVGDRFKRAITWDMRARLTPSTLAAAAKSLRRPASKSRSMRCASASIRAARERGRTVASVAEVATGLGEAAAGAAVANVGAPVAFLGRLLENVALNRAVVEFMAFSPTSGLPAP